MSMNLEICLLRIYLGTDHWKSDGGGGGGGLSACTIVFFFFSSSAYAGIFFAGETLCTIFFFFSDKYCFVCHLLIKKNYFTKELLYFVGFNDN